MIVKFTNLEKYVDIAYSELIDCTIYSNLFKKQYSDNDTEDGSFERNILSQFNAHYKVIIFCALAIEAYFQLLSSRMIVNEKDKSQINKIRPLTKKIVEIIKISYTDTSYIESLINRISILYKYRNKLVHDEGLYSTGESIDLNNEWLKRMPMISTVDAFELLCDIDDVMVNQYHSIKLMDKNYSERFYAWKNNDGFFKPNEDLPFSSISFPNETEYLLTVQRHFGFLPKTVLNTIKLTE